MTATSATGSYSVPVPWLAKITPRLAWWDGKWRSVVFDAFVAFVAISFGDLRSKYLAPGYLALFLVVAVAFVVRRRWPWLAIVAGLALSFVNTTAIAPTIAMYTMARRRGPVLSTWLSVVVTSVSYVLVEYWTEGRSDTNTANINPVLLHGAHFVLLLLAAGVPMLAGLWIHQRSALMNSFRDRAEAAERERALLADAAVTEERRRIAREMHDIVAHRVSVISLQAGALTVTAPDDKTGEVAEIIRKTSADALMELRQMLNVLRADGEAAASAELSSMTLEHVDGLVADAVTAGANVYLDRPDHLPEVSGEVGRAAYRVVQESLTNAGKHAPRAPVRVTLTAGDDGGLRVSVANRRAEGRTAVPGSGYGLIGMRERVTLVGGELSAGPAEDGGYRVEAAFPPGPDNEESA